MFVNGAQGGMVTADNRDLDNIQDKLRGVWHDKREWSECERIGGLLASESLRLLESAVGAQTTLQSPLRWSEDASWKLDYNNVAQLSAEELARRRAEFDRQKEIARGNRAA